MYINEILYLINLFSYKLSILENIFFIFFLSTHKNI